MRKDKNKGAFTLSELIAGLAVLIALCFIGFALLKHISQRTKVVVARTSISQYAMLLETVKGDVNYYPPDTNQTLESLTYPTPPPGYEKGWGGPYLDKLPVDPWKTPYYYRLTYGVIFGPVQCPPRLTGGPYDVTYQFSATPGTGRIIVDNSRRINAGRVWLNGVEVVSNDQFQSNIPTIENNVTLLAQNTLRIRLASNPGRYIFVSITSPFSTKATYIVGSYGSDKQPGGTGFARDLSWTTGQGSPES